ncbi:MAG: hypothetical protein IT288_05445 [Bdellovibrionales bacterium]|nr:hypothetical protein [Bdellovibrionales bacterium]
MKYLIQSLVLVLFLSTTAHAAKVTEIRRGNVTVSEKNVVVSDRELVPLLAPQGNMLTYVANLRIKGVPPMGTTLLFNTVANGVQPSKATSIGTCEFVGVSVTAADTSIYITGLVRGTPNSGLSLDQARNCLTQFMTSLEFRATPFKILLLEGHI